MRNPRTLKIFFVLLYFAVAAPASAILARAALAEDANALRQTSAEGVQLDPSGRRGLVRFNHRAHESRFTPDRNAAHQGRPGVACTVCHHKVEDVTKLGAAQWKCSTCHKPDGDPSNPVDRDGYELNIREAFHLECIGCHRASNVRVTTAKFSNASFTRCSECHDRAAQSAFVAEQPNPWAGLEPYETPPAPPLPAEPAERLRTPVHPPLGFAGPSRIESPAQEGSDTVPVPDRWRIGFPDDPRYTRGSRWNPYRQNVLKGDYPIFGQHNFLNLTATSDSLAVFRRLPVPSDVSTSRSGSAEFFGRGRQFLYQQNFIVTVDYFHGDTSYKPADWRVHVTPQFNVNYLDTQEKGIVNIDVRRGSTRTDGKVALQDAFFEYRLGDTPRVLPFLRGRSSRDGHSPFFDFTSLRFGIQPFVSDFRGFIFNDTNLGTRLFGNYASNRYQFNLSAFHMLEKDTNSELNTFSSRNQTVWIANLYRQDAFFKGYTTQWSVHFNDDRPSAHFDENDFLVRPAKIGSVRRHLVQTAYLGWTGDGHFDSRFHRLNVTHAFYWALGHDTFNPIAGRPVHVNAQMAAVEASQDRDWLRFKASFFWSSGDRNPKDSVARGFDAIFDAPEFAGGKFSFWNSQGVRLTQTGVALVEPNSLLPSLRSSKTEGQANFVNPGLFLSNLGAEAEVTPKLRAIINVNYLRFHRTEPLEAVLFQPRIRKEIGLDYGGGVIYRPLLNETVVIAAGISALFPGTGFKDIYSSNCSGEGCGARRGTLYSGFVRIKITY